VRVPLFRSDPGGATINVGYVLIRHSDPAMPVARGTVALNPGGPGGDVVQRAAEFAEQLARLLVDHDLLLIDPRGTGTSNAIRCAETTVPATRRGFVRAVARCGRRLGRLARAYTSAATADDFDAVRAQLGIPQQRLADYGGVLAALARDETPLRRVAWVERTLPANGDAMADYLYENKRGDASLDRAARGAGLLHAAARAFARCRRGP
jgi:hypothetical protein